MNNNNNLEILEWSYILQNELDKMSHKEFNKFMKNKAIRYEGKLFTVGESDEKRDGKNSKVNTKTSRGVKRSHRESKSIQ